MAVFIWSISVQLCKGIPPVCPEGYHIFCSLGEMVFQSPIVLQTQVSVHRPTSEWVSQGKLQESRLLTKRGNVSKAATSYFQKGLRLSSEELRRCFASFETEPCQRHRIAPMDLTLKRFINLSGPPKSQSYCSQLFCIPWVSIGNIRTAALLKKTSYF